MRLVCTITKKNKEENPYLFSLYLKRLGIDNECEEAANDTFHIWIQDEDQVEKAKALHEEYSKDPLNPRYKKVLEVHRPKTEISEEPASSPRKKQKVLFGPSSNSFFSTTLIIVMVLIYFWSVVHQEISVPPRIEGVFEAPVLKGLSKDLAFDYPHYFELRDELLAFIPKDKTESEYPLPQSGVEIFKEMKKNPFWNGFYERVVAYLKDKSFPIAYHGPLFEKIRQGEIWRIFTPCLMHFNFFHILFNLLWFAILAPQIERRIGFWKFLLLILSTGIIPNVSQYLMSGPFFMGVSGVVVGLAAFIFARQQTAPWEGYVINKATLAFLGFFVIGVFLLQLFLFIIQIFSSIQIEIPIANTAHIMGGIVGYILGRLPFNSVKHKK